MPTTNLPLTTLPTGSTVFGPANVNNNESMNVLVIDRTVTGGLNSLTSATTVELLVEQSNDGGANWFQLEDGMWPGGFQQAFRQPPGTGATSDTIAVSLAPGTSRKVRVTFTVTSGPVVVQGTLTTS